MRRSLLLLALLVIAATGCSLAGDVTPPPDLATAQAATLIPTTPPESEPVWAEPTDAQTLSVDLPLRPPDPANGQVLYLERCAPCHGETGGGDGDQGALLEVPPTELGDPALARGIIPATWYQIVTQGRMERFMPPFTSLSDAERWDVVAYALSISEPADARQNGAQIYETNCAACHTQFGVDLDLQTPEYFASRSAKEIEAVVRVGVEGMPAFGDSLGESERWAVVAYVRSLGQAPPGGSDVTAEPDDPILAEAATIGLVRGDVVNGTTGESPPAGLEVTLVAIDGEQIAFTETTTIDAEGGYSFRDVPVAPGRLFGAFAEYMGVEYFSEGVHILDEGAVDLPLIIFESTEDTSGVRIERLHAIFNPVTENLLEVTELIILSGPADHAIADSDGLGVLEIELPVAFGDLQFVETGVPGNRFFPTSSGFIDLAPLVPGESRELVFSFTIPAGRSTAFDQPLSLPVDAVVLLIPDAGPEIRADGLQDLGVRDMGGALLHNYSLGALQAGETLSLQITRPGLGFTPPNIPGMLIGVSLLVGVAALVGFWWLRVRLGSQERLPPQDEGPAHDGKPALLAAIAALDDEFEAGRIGADEYHARREELKGRALQAMGDRDD